MYDLSGRLGETEEVVRDIIDFSLKINLFNRDIYNVYCVLTSKSIQERYIQAQKRCKKPVREEFDCINVAETPVIVTETTENMTKSAHIILDNIIVNESKVNLQQQQQHACEEPKEEPQNLDEEREQWKDALRELSAFYLPDNGISIFYQCSRIIIYFQNADGVPLVEVACL